MPTLVKLRSFWSLNGALAALAARAVSLAACGAPHKCRQGLSLGGVDLPVRVGPRPSASHLGGQTHSQSVRRPRRSAAWTASVQAGEPRPWTAARPLWTAFGLAGGVSADGWVTLRRQRL